MRNLRLPHEQRRATLAREALSLSLVGAFMALLVLAWSDMLV